MHITAHKPTIGSIKIVIDLYYYLHIMYEIHILVNHSTTDLYSERTIYVCSLLCVCY